MKKAVFLSFIIAAAVIVCLDACSFSDENTAVSEELVGDKALTVMKEFLGSGTKHIEGSYTRIYHDGVTDGPVVFEMWLKDDKVRIDEYDDGTLLRSLYISETAAKYYLYATKSIEAADMPLSYYKDIFYIDAADIESIGSDESGRYAGFKFELGTMYKEEKVEMGYYVTEIIFYTDNSAVKKQVIYGADSIEGEPDVVDKTIFMFDHVETGDVIPDNIFTPQS